MAIIMMTDKEVYDAFVANKHHNKVDVITNYVGHETTRVCHNYDCPEDKRIRQEYGQLIPSDVYDRHYFNSNPSCGCKHFPPLYMETSHVGMVIRIGEHNYYNDSDFYAIVWNSEKQAPQYIEYASTRGWSGPNSAYVDATPEVMAAYNAYHQRLAETRQKENEAAQAKRQAAIDALPSPLTRVQVTNNRSKKAKKGACGTVFWSGYSQFNNDKLVVGLKMDDGSKIYLNADAVKII